MIQLKDSEKETLVLTGIAVVIFFLMYLLMNFVA